MANHGPVLANFWLIHRCFQLEDLCTSSWVYHQLVGVVTSEHLAGFMVNLFQIPVAGRLFVSSFCAPYPSKTRHENHEKSNGCY